MGRNFQIKTLQCKIQYQTTSPDFFPLWLQNNFTLFLSGTGADDLDSVAVAVSSPPTMNSSAAINFCPSFSIAKLKEKLSKIYEVRDPNAIFVFKFQTHFGGGKCTGFDLIYDSVENSKKYEPKHRLIRNGLDTKVEKSRKQMKKKKNRAKKICGVKKTMAGDSAKVEKKK
ncbi:hypothetical protein Vadar_033703 [Vaccinium darrowii]|uniref:Uncharacterized protein n=1 Tax=Vaccinium darrowii TaxID=229202 RepID=A0ACB7ZG99_9ERIC|nr:hypothetical protein Vadar_033703 [Vaccinium darrowii]